jgi:hypothetical protein
MSSNAFCVNLQSTNSSKQPVSGYPVLLPDHVHGRKGRCLLEELGHFRISGGVYRSMRTDALHVRDPLGFRYSVALCSLASVLCCSACVPSLPSKREARGRTLTVCELSRDFEGYADQLMAVRGVYYNGLRQICPQRCPSGEPWPSVLDLAEANSGYPWSGERSSFSTDTQSWYAVDKLVLQTGGSGDKVELWVTVLGQLKVRTSSPSSGPCDWVANGMSNGLQVRGRFGGVLVVKRFFDIEPRPNPKTPYDYTVLRRKPKR